MTTILAAVFGALLAGSFALLGARVGHKRDHEKWLRDARQRAYESLVVAVNRFQLWSTEIARAGNQDGRAEMHTSLNERINELVLAACAVRIVGPKAVSDAGDALKSVMLDDGMKGGYTVTIVSAEMHFLDLARGVLQTDND